MRRLRITAGLMDLIAITFDAMVESSRLPSQDVIPCMTYLGYAVFVLQPPGLHKRSDEIAAWGD